MKKYYPVIFTKEDTGFSTAAVDLDGCFSEGDTFEEAYKSTQDAIGLFLDGIEVLPEPSDPSTLAVPEGQFVAIVEYDSIAYRKKNGSKSVKKTLSIPEWLNDEAERQHINFSKLLQEALKNKLNV